MRDFVQNVHVLGLERAVRLYSRHAHLGIAAISLASTVRRAVSTAASTASRTYSRTCTKPNSHQGSLECGREGDVALSPAGKGAAVMHHADQLIRLHQLVQP
ncbi:MAG: hypothetical protein FRX49_03859 [Trebouxia sp. A1-2]|nr:MAG: hypothetical protein FRX49_03859 [Trebouxia sp. A1-2]